jgi:transcriptional regulator with XRE-family HTH domain
VDVNTVNSPENNASKLAEQFAQNVKRTRDRLGLTQAQLAERSGMTPAAISQLEGGQREPSFSTIVKVAAALKTSPNDLMGLGETSPDPSLKALYREITKLDQDAYEKVSAFARWLAQQSKE